MPGETPQGGVLPEEVYDADLKTFLEILGIEGGNTMRARMELQRYQPRDGVSVIFFQGKVPFIRQEFQADVIRFLIANYERFMIEMDVDGAQKWLEKIVAEEQQLGPIPSDSGTYEVSPEGQSDMGQGQRIPPPPLHGFLTRPGEGGPSPPLPSPLGGHTGTAIKHASEVPGLGIGPETEGSDSSLDVLAHSGTGTSGADTISRELSDLASEHGEEFAQKVEELAGLYAVEQLIEKATDFNNTKAYSDAHAHLEAVLLKGSEEAQSNLEFYLQTGRCFEGLGRLREARDTYSAALEIEPNEFAQSRYDALTEQKLDEPSGEEPGKETAYEAVFEERFAPLGIDLKSPEALAAKGTYVRIRKLIENGESDELDNNQAVESLQSMPPQFDVSSEIGLIGNVQYAKWLAFQARQQTDNAEMQKLYTQSVGVLDNVLKAEPKFKEARLLSEQYRTEMG